jgi:hypothetical protein
MHMTESHGGFEQPWLCCVWSRSCRCSLAAPQPRGLPDCGLRRLARPGRYELRFFALRPTASRTGARVSSPDDWKTRVRLNKLLGLWAAEQMGTTGIDAEAYSDALALCALDPERSDVLSAIRKDFENAGVAQSDEEILRVFNELTLQAGNQMPVTRGGAADALTVMLARKLSS